jgi:very-short-patch-repair endonuclease
MKALRIPDIEKQKARNIKGFYACCNSHNQQHDKNVYSIAEEKFRKILVKHKIEFLHEFKIKCKNLKNHTYYIDFFIPKQRVAIEINPKFHNTLNTVKYTDVLREKLLLNHGIKTITINVYYHKQHGKIEPYLNETDIKKVLKILRKNETSCNTLDYYVA